MASRIAAWTLAMSVVFGCTSSEDRAREEQIRAAADSVTAARAEREAAEREMADARKREALATRAMEPDVEYAIRKVEDYTFLRPGVSQYRARLVVEITTGETATSRIMEAMMRTAMTIALERKNEYGDLPDVVQVGVLEAWPRPEFSAYTHSVYYAPDRCGWTGAERECDGRFWDPFIGVTDEDIPEWIHAACDDVLRIPCGWWLT